MRITLIIAATLSLAACGAPEPETAPSNAPSKAPSSENHAHSDEKEIQPTAPVSPSLPEMADEAEPDEDVAQENGAARIPARFLGEWDYIEGTIG